MDHGGQRSDQKTTSKRIVTGLKLTLPKCDGSYPGWQFRFFLAKNSAVTLQEVKFWAKVFFPEGMDEFSISEGGEVTVRILATRYMDRPSGVNQFHAWLLGLAIIEE